ncbi:ABC-2 type transporter [Methanolacinia petrolearia DSM 11571]|uniref:ABC-2 type transporter n=1 Tax=Methanolacinia petrolearia (strain DSM 11571 / OCM 486 / SEBR 4847) TaxID=679926 RepID=E1REZ3_METP4|nr:ABC transporter permease [Methanolacinia petrolearia]ADN36164.1 ABC-2 type transporter [Methanolacinia petrolearia DSM 11571]
MNFSLITEFAKRDLTERYSGSLLGFAWNFIFPLANIIVYTFIFSSIMGARLPGSSDVFSYGVYICAGILPWTAFASMFTRISTIFPDKRHILTKLNTNLRYFPLYIVISESVIFAGTMVFFFLFLIYAGYQFSWLLVFVPVIYFIQVLFAYSLGFFLANFMVFLKDLRETIQVVLLFWFWFTPIVYVYDILPDFAKSVIIWNPMTAVVNGYQSIFVYNEIPGFTFLTYVLLLSIFMLLLSFWIFNRLEKDIRDFM